MPKPESKREARKPGKTERAVSLVIPTLNEAENLTPLIAEIMVAVDGRFTPEIIIADGASDDGTQDIVRDLARKYPVRLLPCTRADGLAGAVMAGSRAAKNEIVLVMDADHSHPPDAIPGLVEPIQAGAQDMVIGSRFVRGGATPDWSRWRRLCSRVASLLTWPFTDLSDPLAGFFAVRRESLLALGDDAVGFKIGLQTLLNAGEGFRVAEVPITFRERAKGQSKMGGKVIVQYLMQMLVLAGGVVNVGTATRFGLVGLTGLVADLGVFEALTLGGVELGSAHVASFLVATVVNFVLNKYWTFAGAGTPPLHGVMGYARFFIVCLLALFIRGGVLAVLTQLWGVPPTIAILAGIAAAAVINYLGSALFVFPTAIGVCDPDVRWRVAAMGVVVYSVLLRLLYLGLPDLIPQEAYYWNYSQHLDIGYLDHPPMVSWLIWLGGAVFGHSEFAVRVGALLCWGVTALFSYLLARNLYGKFEGLVSVMFLALLPIYFATGFLMTPDAPLIACWAAALYFLERALLAERRNAWWAVGACVGLGMLSKYSMVLIVPPILAFALLDARARRWLWHPVPYAAAVLAFLIFSPVVIWNHQHGWVSFAFQSVRRFHGAARSDFLEFLGSAVLLLTPPFLVSLGAGLALRHRAGGSGAGRRRGLFMALFTVLPVSVFVFYSFISPKAPFYWTAPGWLAAFPFVAWSIRRGLSAAQGFAGWAPRFWMPAVLAALLIYGAGLHYLVLGLPGIGYNENFPGTMNWRELGRQVEDIEQRLIAETGAEPQVVGLDKYAISSEVTFYGGDTPIRDGAREVIGSYIFGSNSLMYRFWAEQLPGPEAPLILVADKVKWLNMHNVTRCFSKTDPIQPLVIKRGKHVVGRYYALVGYEFNCRATSSTSADSRRARPTPGRGRPTAGSP